MPPRSSSQRGRGSSRRPTPVSRGNTPGIHGTTSRSRETTPGSLPRTPLTTPEHSDSESHSHPAVVASPVRRRQRREAPGIRAQTDLEVWDLLDEDIISKFPYTPSLVIMLQSLLAASRAVWRSEVYDHYDVSLIRECAEDGSPHHLNFIFTCKMYPTTHSHTRARSKTSGGTSNLQLGVAQCNKRHGISSTQVSKSGPPYSEAAHRALIALRCAKNHRPFNSVLDDDYQTEVQMLRPGTKVPHPMTVSRDVNAMYFEMSKHVRNYFQACFPTFYILLFNYMHK
jgi:hypothetical protein